VTIDQAKGQVKQAAGTPTVDDTSEAKRRADEAADKVETAIGPARHKAGDATTHARKAVKE
jgi:uncharacterized protein YjbJ (UPF0337 family)